MARKKREFEMVKAGGGGGQGGAERFPGWGGPRNKKRGT